jgi:hypothetical protein
MLLLLLHLLPCATAGGPTNGALTIATTHHSIMTGLKFDDGRVENASVEFDEEKLAPTYKLLWGVPGGSLNKRAFLFCSELFLLKALHHCGVGHCQHENLPNLLTRHYHQCV